MEHIITFLILLALLCAVALITITLMLRRQYRQQASSWFASALAGLACFVLEILIYRYAVTLKNMSAPASTGAIMDFSNFWALSGGVLITLSMPRLARLMTGLSKNTFWGIAEIALPGFTFLAGLAFILHIGGLIPGIILQSLVFGTIIAAVLCIALTRPQKPELTDRRFLVRILVWSALCLPLIILDAFGGILPAFLNDLPIGLFLPGLCLIAMPEVPKLFGSPVYLQEGQPSSHFLRQFEISSREAEVVALVVAGVNNAEIADRLCISGKTVENHLTSIFRKTRVKNRIQLFRLINSSRDS